MNIPVIKRVVHPVIGLVLIIVVGWIRVGRPEGSPGPEALVLSGLVLVGDVGPVVVVVPRRVDGGVPGEPPEASLPPLFLVPVPDPAEDHVPEGRGAEIRPLPEVHRVPHEQREGRVPGRGSGVDVVGVADDRVPDELLRVRDPVDARGEDVLEPRAVVVGAVVVGVVGGIRRQRRRGDRGRRKGSAVARSEDRGVPPKEAVPVGGRR